MSQQQMNFNEVNPDGPAHPYAGYEGVRHSDDYSTSFSGQKLAGQAGSLASKVGHRGPVLAIGSLVLWLVFFLFALFVSVSVTALPFQALFGFSSFE